MILPSFTSSKLPSASTAMTVIAMVIPVAYLNLCRKIARKPFPTAIPKICTTSVLLELLYYYIATIKTNTYENPRSFFRSKRKELDSTVFFLGPLLGAEYACDVLVITDPANQANILRKEKYLEMTPALPETVTLIEGYKNMQNLRGKMHASCRKIYSSILKPRSLDSFIPYMMSYFNEMWDNLEDNIDSASHIRLIIRDTQLKLMCEILFGMKCETEEEKEAFIKFRDDFELTEKALFSPGIKSEAFKKGIEAKNRIAEILYSRFDKTYQERMKHHDDVATSPDSTASAIPSSKDKNGTEVGNAMVIIADALLKDRSADDSAAMYEVAKENLYLLLEASHGTTMHITTAMMYFLNHPDNKLSLDTLRTEVASMKNDDCSAPNHELFKRKMLFGDGCINEAMRLASIAGGVGYHVPKGKTIEIQKKKLDGPLILQFANSHWYEDPEVFSQPEKFMPQRWMSGDKDEVSNFARSVFKPFGDGRHICLGMNLARLVMQANLFCFAQKQSRSITFDSDAVKIEYSLFPEKKVSDNFVGRVIS
jgi:cytochrome P450